MAFDWKNEHRGREVSLTELLGAVKQSTSDPDGFFRLQFHVPGCHCPQRPGPSLQEADVYCLCADHPRWQKGPGTRIVLPNSDKLYVHLSPLYSSAANTHARPADRYEDERDVNLQVQEAAASLDWPVIEDSDLDATSGLHATAAADGADAGGIPRLAGGVDHNIDVRCALCALRKFPNASVAVIGRERRMVELVTGIYAAREAGRQRLNSRQPHDRLNAPDRRSILVPVRLEHLVAQFEQLNLQPRSGSSVGHSSVRGSSYLGSGSGGRGSEVYSWTGSAASATASFTSSAFQSAVGGGEDDVRSVGSSASAAMPQAGVSSIIDGYGMSMRELVYETLEACGQEELIEHVESTGETSVLDAAGEITITPGQHLKELMMLCQRLGSASFMTAVLDVFGFEVDNSSTGSGPRVRAIGGAAANSVIGAESLTGDPGSLVSSSMSLPLQNFSVLCVLQHEHDLSVAKVQGRTQWELNLPGGKRRLGSGSATAALMRFRTETKIKGLPVPHDRNVAEGAPDDPPAHYTADESVSLAQEVMQADADPEAVQCPSDVRHLSEAFPLSLADIYRPDELYSKVLFFYTAGAVPKQSTSTSAPGPSSSSSACKA